MDATAQNSTPPVEGMERWKRWRLGLSIVIVVLLGILILLISDTVRVSMQPHSISVHVTDKDGLPVRDATVYLSGGGDEYFREKVAKREMEISDMNQWLRDAEHRLTDTDESGKALITGRFRTEWHRSLLVTGGTYDFRGDLQVKHPGYQDWQQSLRSYFRSSHASMNHDAQIEVILTPE